MDAARTCPEQPRLVDDVGGFWVVTAATPGSELDDILVKHTVAEIGLSFIGGLRAKDIIGVFKDEERARAFALKQLPSQDSGPRP